MTNVSVAGFSFFIHMDMALLLGVFRLYRDDVATANHEATYRCLVPPHYYMQQAVKGI